MHRCWDRDGWPDVKVILVVSLLYLPFGEKQENLGKKTLERKPWKENLGKKTLERKPWKENLGKKTLEKNKKTLKIKTLICGWGAGAPMRYESIELIEQRRRLVELAENAAREHYETIIVENDDGSTPDDIIRAKDAERRARRAYVRKRQELCCNIDAAARENGIEPNSRIRSRILDALLSYI